ncbi:hypothetical protein [Paenibacillus popilliae]|uniref:Putative primosome component n=1 Tax=Paenibacillus popilliae ATCC 14706 TaxID=1212764 RepID=M9M737_PAEPP|nr:hypothetical protein [Paenibacillus popilliae]GAC43468.1 putative primosome component [Paenibacillus popilliae ATCC 14706]
MAGWIKDYRQELESDIWSMPPLYHRIWQYLKYMVNHHENEIPMRDGTRVEVSPGQHMTSLRNIAKGVGWYERGIWKEPNVKTVSSVLGWLEKEGMITVDSGNRKYTMISLVSWDIYQADDDIKVTVGKQSLDINKNDKNEKNNNISAQIENFRSRYNPELLELIDNYFEFIANMRKGKKLSDGILIKVYEQFARYSPLRVEYAIKTHMGSEKLSKAKEDYTFGILRGTTDEEAKHKLQRMNNQQQRAGGRLSPEELQALERGQ